MHDLKHECGVFGAYNIPRIYVFAFYGLYALQHRARGAGIVTCINLSSL